VIKAVETLRTRGQTISFAESCTGGLLSAVFTRMPGVSDVFAGSLVAYSYAVKESLLDVPRAMLRAMGAVSAPVARKMAEGARSRLQTTWAIAITGVAGPGGGTAAKPVGAVCFAISGPGVEKTVQRHFKGTRREVQLASVRFALKLLLHELGV
jgi:nicotinamide-nucleotide amidase